METRRCHGVGVTPRLGEVPVGEDGLVGVPDDEDSPSSELSQVMSPPGQTVLIDL